MEDAERLFDEIDKIAPRLSAKKKAEIVEAAWNWARERNLQALKSVAISYMRTPKVNAPESRYIAEIAKIERVTTPSTKASDEP